MSPKSSPGRCRRPPMHAAAAEFLRNFNVGRRSLYAGLNHADGRGLAEGSAMCQATSTKGRRSAIVGPRWGVLYAVTLPQLAVLGAVEAVHSPNPVRLTLRFLLALGLFATMSVWLRVNRPAL